MKHGSLNDKTNSTKREEIKFIFLPGNIILWKIDSIRVMNVDK